MAYKAIKLVKRPDGFITPDIVEVATLASRPLQAGEVRVRHTHRSLDPAMRGWMNATRKSDVPPVALGSVMRAMGLGEVIESTSPDVPVGARVTGMC